MPEYYVGADLKSASGAARKFGPNWQPTSGAIHFYVRADDYRQAWQRARAILAKGQEVRTDSGSVAIPAGRYVARRIVLSRSEAPSAVADQKGVLIRIPETLHDALKRRAEQLGVSLNALIVVLLSQSLGSSN